MPNKILRFISRWQDRASDASNHTGILSEEKIGKSSVSTSNDDRDGSVQSTSPQTAGKAKLPDFMSVSRARSGLADNDNSSFPF